jgi:outer membrane protein insertion porin family
MQRLLLRTIIFLIAAVFSSLTINAQEDTTKPTSVDPNLLALENARIPKEYKIAGINLSGVHYLDTAIVMSIANIQVGDKVLIPGGDLFSKAIQNLWRQKLFSDIQIYITKVEADSVSVWIEISVTERPRLGNFKFD